MRKYGTLIIYFLTLLITTGIKFLIFENYDNFFILTLFVDLITIIVSYIILDKKAKATDTVYSYTFIEIMISLILFISVYINSIISLFNFSEFIYIVITIILYSLFFISYIVVNNSKKMVGELQKNTKEKTSNWRIYTSKLETADKKLLSNDDYKKLIELFKYSDPINNTDANLDQEIFNIIDLLIDKCDTKLIEELTSKIKKRNDIVRIKK